MKIYVASSWRNKFQKKVVEILRSLGHEVYDFKNPPKKTGFSWSEIDPNWQQWNPEQYKRALSTPRAQEGFDSDMRGLDADACVLVQPCGTSAHLELGWACGKGIQTAVLYPLDIESEDGSFVPRIEPELMVKMADVLLLSEADLRLWIQGVEAHLRAKVRKS